ncbi:hypothetical protein HYH03_008594 [Edaphochlamys debaryana]|uniref:Non-specific serine/threonine protein kinase n=1 Tax=Edaphochlamys debaryana TaxID=47281 RepID=A0A835XY03_9CHLO|nr:hypothetical protein HYH03_008594 [Edaphochlamys debaryana]|eukprot:KAG2493172.1 hypothetical protein HYH03_008594 [Edaphochlamys debaryana]
MAAGLLGVECRDGKQRAADVPVRVAESSYSPLADTSGVQWVIRPGPPVDSVYELGETLGQGSFGVVHAATHRTTGQAVAVKSIRKSLLRPEDVGKLRREVEILHHLAGHPNISLLLGVHEDPTHLHLVLELYQGGDLYDAIIAVGRHSERAAADMMRVVLGAVSYCHAMGVAHRDIKPENFMLTVPSKAADKKPRKSRFGADPSAPAPEPEAPISTRLKLIDFGLSAFCTDVVPLREVVGTSYYVAPEVLERCYGRAADIWSCGIILHVLLTGSAPFNGKNDQEIVEAIRKGRVDLSNPMYASLSLGAREVLAAMLDRDPARRATADELLAAPWLGRTPSDCTAPTEPLPGVVSERLRAFARLDSFAKEARRVVAGLMRQEEVAGLVAAFKDMDADGDGKLSLEELKEGLARQELRFDECAGSGGRPPLMDTELAQLVQMSDLNGDGQLDQSEFLAVAVPAAAIRRHSQQAVATVMASSAAGGLISISRRASATVSAGAACGSGEGGLTRRAASGLNPLEAAFAHFDADGSGYITADELRAALAEHHPQGKGPDVEELIRHADVDSDGRISYAEFLLMMLSAAEGGPAASAAAAAGLGAAAGRTQSPAASDKPRPPAVERLQAGEGAKRPDTWPSGSGSGAAGSGERVACIGVAPPVAASDVVVTAPLSAAGSTSAGSSGPLLPAGLILKDPRAQRELLRREQRCESKGDKGAPKHGAKSAACKEVARARKDLSEPLTQRCQSSADAALRPGTGGGGHRHGHGHGREYRKSGRRCSTSAWADDEDPAAAAATARAVAAADARSKRPRWGLDGAASERTSPGLLLRSVSGSSSDDDSRAAVQLCSGQGSPLEWADEVRHTASIGSIGDYSSIGSEFVAHARSGDLCSDGEGVIAEDVSGEDSSSDEMPAGASGDCDGDGLMCPVVAAAAAAAFSSGGASPAAARATSASRPNTAARKQLLRLGPIAPATGALADVGYQTGSASRRRQTAPAYQDLTRPSASGAAGPGWQSGPIGPAAALLTTGASSNAAAAAAAARNTPRAGGGPGFYLAAQAAALCLMDSEGVWAVNSSRVGSAGGAPAAAGSLFKQLSFGAGSDLSGAPEGMVLQAASGGDTSAAGCIPCEMPDPAAAATAASLAAAASRSLAARPPPLQVPPAPCGSYRARRRSAGPGLDHSRSGVGSPSNPMSSRCPQVGEEPSTFPCGSARLCVAPSFGSRQPTHQLSSALAALESMQAAPTLLLPAGAGLRGASITRAVAAELGDSLERVPSGRLTSTTGRPPPLLASFTSRLGNGSVNGGLCGSPRGPAQAMGNSLMVTCPSLGPRAPGMPPPPQMLSPHSASRSQPLPPPLRDLASPPQRPSHLSTIHSMSQSQPLPPPSPLSPRSTAGCPKAHLSIATSADDPVGPPPPSMYAAGGVGSASARYAAAAPAQRLGGPTLPPSASARYSAGGAPSPRHYEPYAPGPSEAGAAGYIPSSRGGSPPNDQPGAPGSPSASALSSGGSTTRSRRRHSIDTPANAVQQYQLQPQPLSSQLSASGVPQPSGGLGSARCSAPQLSLLIQMPLSPRGPAQGRGSRLQPGSVCPLPSPTAAQSLAGSSLRRASVGASPPYTPTGAAASVLAGMSVRTSRSESPVPVPPRSPRTPGAAGSGCGGTGSPLAFGPAALAASNAAVAMSPRSGASGRLGPSRLQHEAHTAHGGAGGMGGGSASAAGGSRDGALDASTAYLAAYAGISEPLSNLRPCSGGVVPSLLGGAGKQRNASRK